MDKIRKYTYEKLIKLMQADYSGCKDDLSISPSVIKWRRILDAIVKEGIPTKESELKVKSATLIELGYKGESLGKVRKDLLLKCISEPNFNDKEKMIKYAVDNLSKYIH